MGPRERVLKASSSDQIDGLSWCRGSHSVYIARFPHLKPPQGGLFLEEFPAHNVGTPLHALRQLDRNRGRIAYILTDVRLTHSFSPGTDRHTADRPEPP